MSAQRDYPVIDADVHIHEDPAELARFAEGPLRQGLEHTPDAGYWLDAPDYSPLTPYDPPICDVPGREVHVVRSPGELRADLDGLGIDAAIVYTGRLLNTAIRPEPAYPVAVMHAYNRYLQEVWLRPAEGICGAIMVAAQDPGASAAEIERYAGVEGFAAVYLPMAGVQPLWGHRRYDPIYAAAEAAGLPVVLHGYTQVYPIFPYQLELVETALAKQLLAKPFGTMANFASMVTGGVLARFPRLKAVFTECGVGWLPYLLGRLDRQFAWTWAELPFYSSPPSAQILPQVYLTTHSLELASQAEWLVPWLEHCGLQDRLLFASDWPHYDADRVERVAALPLPEAWRRRILHQNATEVFKLPAIARRSPPAGIGATATS